jgi:hypothetical protein
MFADLETGALTHVLRPTMLFAVVAGVLGMGVAVLLGSPLAAVGIALGVAVAILNVRFLGAGVARVETDGADRSAKVVRRILRRGSALRLVTITALAIVLMLVQPPLGIGMMVGLVLFQIAFVANVGRAVLSSGVV